MSQIAHDMLLNDALSEAELTGSPMTINGMKLLQMASENAGIELTKSGFLNRKCVVWAADEFQWPGYAPEQLYRLNKVLNEQDLSPLSVMHGVPSSPWVTIIEHARPRMEEDKPMTANQSKIKQCENELKAIAGEIAQF